ncbi:MAG: hypothetical protein ACLP8A_18355 [Methylovirgula sp.]
MSTRPLIKIDGFARLVEVVGYGKVHKPSGGGAEVEIEVFLAHPDPATRYTFSRSERAISRLIGCGQLPLMPIGSRWQNGRMIEHRRSPPTSNLISFRSVIDLSDLVEDDDARFYPLRGQEQAPFYKVMLGDTYEHKVAIIPVMEFIRALFGASSGFLRQMFDGIRNPAVTRDRFLIDRSNSGWKNKETVLLSCSRRPTRAEAMTSALILTNEKVRRAHDAVFAKLSASRSWHNEGSEFVEMPYPFGMPVQCSFESRWILIEAPKKGPQPRMLITRILSMVPPCEFKTIEVIYPGGTHVEDLPQPQERQQVTHASALRLQTKRAPGSGRAAIDATAAGVSFEDAKVIEITYKPHGSGARPEQTLRQDHQREEIEASTADRRSGGGTDVAHVEIRSNQRNSSHGVSNAPDVHLASLMLTCAAVAYLATQNNWRIARGPDRQGKLPLVKVQGEGWQADLLFMILETDFGPVVIADMGSVEGDPRALGLIARRSGKGIDQWATYQILNLTKKTGGRWFGHEDELKGFEIKAIRRPGNAWHDEKHYAQLIARGINSLFSGLAT